MVPFSSAIVRTLDPNPLLLRANGVRPPIMAPRNGLDPQLSSRMNRPSLRCQGGFVDGFVHGWVGVDGADEFFGCGFEAAGEGHFGDEFGGLVAHDVAAEDFAAGEGADDFGEAFGVV